MKSSKWSSSSSSVSSEVTNISDEVESITMKDGNNNDKKLSPFGAYVPPLFILSTSSPKINMQDEEMESLYPDVYGGIGKNARISPTTLSPISSTRSPSTFMSPNNNNNNDNNNDKNVAKQLQLEKNKQQWNFLDRPESPKTLVFNFYELEENSQKMIKKKRLKPIREIKTIDTRLSPKKSIGTLGFKKGYIFSSGIKQKVWEHVFLIVDSKLPLAVYYESSDITRCLGMIDIKSSKFIPTGLNKTHDNLPINTFAVTSKHYDKVEDKTEKLIVNFGCKTREEMMSWLHFFYESKRNEIKRSRIQKSPMCTPPNTLITSERSSTFSDMKERINIKIGRSPRLVPISKIMEKNENLITGLGYILKEQYHGGPILPFHQEEFSAIRIQTMWRGYLAKEYVWGYHGLSRSTWASLLVQRCLRGHRIRWQLRITKRAAIKIQRLWKNHKLARLIQKQHNEYKRKLKRAGAYFKNSALMRIISAWKSLTQTQKKAQKLLRKVLSGVLASTFYRWEEYTTIRRGIRQEKTRMMQKEGFRKAKFFLRRLLLRHAATALNQWHDVVEKNKRMKKLLQRVLHGELKTHYLAWIEYHKQMVKCRLLRKKVFSHIYARYLVKWEIHVMRNQACKKIQKAYRIYWATGRLVLNIRWNQYIDDCAHKIQNVARKFLAWLEVWGPFGLFVRNKRSIEIQAWFRCYSAIRKYRTYLYKLSLTQIRCRSWFRRRVSAAIFIQCVWRRHDKWWKKKLWATLKVQRAFRTYCAFNIFTQVKRFFYKTFLNEWTTISLLCKVASKHYCMCYGIWRQRKLFLQITVAKTGKTFFKEITLMKLINVIENDSELHFKPVTLDQVLVKLCKQWIHFVYDDSKNLQIDGLKASCKYDNLLLKIKDVFTSITGYPTKRLKNHYNIQKDFGFIKDEQAEVIKELSKVLPFLDEFNVDEGKAPPSILFEKLLQANTIHDMALILEERGKNVVTKILSNVKMVGIKVLSKSLYYDVREDIMKLIQKRQLIKDSLGILEKNVQAIEKERAIARTQHEESKLKLQNINEEYKRKIAVIELMKERSEMIAADVESYYMEIIAPREAEVEGIEKMISTLHEELDGGFYYDALPGAQAELAEYEAEILIAKADIEMEEYDSDDIDEISSSITKTQKKIDRIINNLENDENWLKICEQRALLPIAQAKLERAEKKKEEMIQEYDDASVKINKTIVDVKASLRQKWKITKDFAMTEKFKAEKEEDFERLDKRLARSKGTMNSIASIVQVKKMELKKAKVLLAKTSELDMITEKHIFFNQTLFPQLRQLDIDTALPEWIRHMKNTTIYDEHYKDHLSLLQDILKYEELEDLQERFECGKQVQLKAEKLGLKNQYIGSQSAFIAESEIIFLMNLCVPNAFASIKQILFKHVSHLFVKDRQLGSISNLQMISPIPQFNFNERWSEFLYVEFHKEIDKFSNYLQIEYELDRFALDLGDRLEYLNRKLFAYKGVCANLAKYYDDLLTEKKKKNLNGAIDMRIRALLMSFSMRNLDSRAVIQSYIDHPINRKTSGILSRLKNFRNAMKTRFNNYKSNIGNRYTEMLHKSGHLLASVATNLHKDVAKYKIYLVKEANDLLFVQLPLLKKTAEDFNAALLSQKQNIDHAMDSICEFECNCFLYMEDIDDQETRFLGIYEFLHKKYDWSVKKANHLEKVACREEAKQYGGNLPFVRRIRKMRRAATQIQQGWHSRSRRLKIKTVPGIWNQINENVELLITSTSTLINYAKDEKIQETYPEEFETMSKIEAKIKFLVEVNKSHILPQCKFTVADIRNLASNIGELVTKIEYVTFRGASKSKKDILNMLKSLKMIHTLVMKMTYIYRPEERPAFEEESVFSDAMSIEGLASGKRPPISKMIGKGLKFIVVNPATRYVAHQTGRGVSYVVYRIKTSPYLNKKAVRFRYFWFRLLPDLISAPHSMKIIGATKFQALVRGHLTRVRLLDEMSSEDELDDIFSSEDDEEGRIYMESLRRAARCIQRCYRSYIARKHVRDLAALYYRKIKSEDGSKYVYRNTITNTIQATKPLTLGRFDLATPRSFKRGMMFSAAYYKEKKWKKKKKVRLTNVLMHSIIRPCSAEYCEKVETRPLEFAPCSEGCNLTYYCSRACERSHWGKHARACKKERTKVVLEDEEEEKKGLPFDFVDKELINTRIEGVINKALNHLQQNGQMPERWELANY